MDILILGLILAILILFIIILSRKSKFIKKNRKLIVTVLVLVFFILTVYLIYDLISKDKKRSNIKEKFNQHGGKVNLNTKRDKMMKLCGIHDYAATSHCFNDSTHHTCCLLGPKAREYSNKENPIGKASEEAFKLKYGVAPKKTDLTSWCTCTGSEVCSFYGQFNEDGTKIKFINDPRSDTDISFNPNIDSESYYRKRFKIPGHGTPGVHMKKLQGKPKRSYSDKQITKKIISINNIK